MTDVRRARRDAEKATREALSGTLVDKAGELGVALAGQAGELGVALAGQADAAENVASARTKAQTIMAAAQAEGAALVAAAEAEASKADDAYSTAWNAGKDAGWTPAQLRSMGYTKPPATRRPSAAAIPADDPHNDDAEHIGAKVA